jgi:metal-responsive CopG/Arc/MetJ family transcriptional regulator
MALDKSERLDLRVSAELLERIDAWRRRQNDNPSRVEAIRRLIDTALSEDRAGEASRQFGKKPA